MKTLLVLAIFACVYSAVHAVKCFECTSDDGAGAALPYSAKCDDGDKQTSISESDTTYVKDGCMSCKKRRTEHEVNLIFTKTKVIVVERTCMNTTAGGTDGSCEDGELDLVLYKQEWKNCYCDAANFCNSATSLSAGVFVLLAVVAFKYFY